VKGFSRDALRRDALMRSTSRTLKPATLPLLTNASRPLVVPVDAVDHRGVVVPTPIAGEHPLTLYVDKCEVVTLMTLGQAPEALAIGYLRNQRLVSSLDELAAVQVDWETEAVAVTTRRGVKSLAKKLSRRTVTTGCGQGTMFGDLMEEVDSIRLRDDVRLSEESLFAVFDAVRRQETVYNAAGAVHGCALASNEGADSRILIFVEDVGRHNAVDAIAGRMWLDDIDGSDKIFYTTGRLTSEMVIKTAQMGIPFLVSRSGLTEMGWRIASRVGLTMLGRASGKHYLLFTGQHRFEAARAS
jgi:FdhD protein